MLRVRWMADSEKRDQALTQLQEELDLPTYPRRIECYDNSNIQGTNPVASMVVFIDGQPKTSEYRRFRIKTVDGANDFASMAEILGRRFKRWENSKGEIVEPEIGQALNTTVENPEPVDGSNEGDVSSEDILSLVPLSPVEGSKDADGAASYYVADSSAELRAAETKDPYSTSAERVDGALTTPPPDPLPAGGEGEFESFSDEEEDDEATSWDGAPCPTS